MPEDITISNPAAELSLVRARTIEAREQRRLLRERQRAAKQGLATESFSIAGQEFVDPRDYLPQGWGFQSIYGMNGVNVRSNLFDRERGDNRPFIRNENDAAWVRGLARFITTTNCAGVGILENLANYVVGTGGTATVKTKKHQQVPQGLLAAVQDFVDEFVETNGLKGMMDRELFQRARRDGEYFYGVFRKPETNAVVGRVIEPDSVRDPGGQSIPAMDLFQLHNVRCPHEADNTYGVHTDAHDVLNVHGYYVQWTTEEPFDYLPARYVAHCKLNVDSTVKRGMSDFYPGWQWLQQAARLLKNTGEGAAEAAAISYIVEYVGATSDDVRAMRQQMENVSYLRWGANGADQTGKHFRDPGTVLNVPAGQQYKDGPMSSDRGNAFLEVVNGILRHTAVRWAMSEGMLTGDDSNNNMASAVEAGSRFYKFCEASQGRMSLEVRKILWMAIEVAAALGRFAKFRMTGEQIRRVLRIEVTYPELAVTKALEAEQVREIRANAGVLSTKTWSDEAGLDYEIEVAQGAKAGTGDGGPPGSDSMDGGLGGGPPGMPKIPGAPHLPGQPGQPQPGQPQRPGAAPQPPKPGGQQQPGAGDQQPPEQPLGGDGGEYKDMNQIGWKRNQSRILDTLEKMATGQMRPAVGRELLGTLGLDGDRIERLIADISDDGQLTPDSKQTIQQARPPQQPQKVSPEQAQQIAEEAAVYALGRLIVEDCGDGAGGFQPGNSCGNGGGSGEDGELSDDTKEMVTRTIDTSAMPDESINLGNAGYLENGRIYAAHVTDDPTVVQNALASGKSLADRKGHEIGPGLYVSNVPEFWTGRSTGKYEFLGRLTGEEKDKLTNALTSQIDQQLQDHYITASEAESAKRNIDHVKNGTLDPDALVLAASQPFNIGFHKPEFLQSIGIKPSKQPAAVPVELTGKFAELKGSPSEAHVRDLQAHGYDGAYTKSDFSTSPQLVVWNNSAVRKFGDYESTKRRVSESLAAECGGEGSGRPGPCPEGGTATATKADDRAPDFGNKIELGAKAMRDAFPKLPKADDVIKHVGETLSPDEFTKLLVASGVDDLTAMSESFDQEQKFGDKIKTHTAIIIARSIMSENDRAGRGREAVAQAGDAKGIELTSADGSRKLLVHPSAHPGEKGKYQLTKVDSYGPMGHSIFASRDEALLSAIGAHPKGGFYDDGDSSYRITGLSGKGKPTLECADRRWLDRVLFEDCGTGAGGFQPGNTCGKGEGGGGTAVAEPKGEKGGQTAGQSGGQSSGSKSEKAGKTQDHQAGQSGQSGGDRPKLHELFDRIQQPDGGFTYDAKTDTEPTSGYPVSPFPEHSFAKPAKDLKFDDLVGYVHDHWDQIQQADNHLGAWHDPKTGMAVLDVVVVSKTPEEADKLARDHDQKSYFDLKNGKSIEVNPNATSGGVLQSTKKGEGKSNGESAAKPSASQPAGPNNGARPSGDAAQPLQAADRKGADGSRAERSGEKAGQQVRSGGNDVLRPIGGIAHPKDAADLERFVKDVAASPVHKDITDRLTKLGQEAGGKVEAWSQSKYSDGKGNYTPDRQKLHDDIVAKLMNPKAVAPEGERPIAMLTLGPPGAGKTSSVNMVGGRLGKEFTNINSDDVKEMLPEYKGWNGGSLHNESNDVAIGELLGKASEARHNIVFDSTGSRLDKMQQIVKSLTDRGYDVHLLNVDLPSEKAAARAWDRFAAGGMDPNTKTGRFVPLDFVAHVDHKPEGVYQKLKDDPNVKAWTSVSNDVPYGEQPRELERGQK